MYVLVYSVDSRDHELKFPVFVKCQGLQQQVCAEDVLSTVELLAHDLPRCAKLLRVAPQFKRQQDSYDKVLRIITHLLHLVIRLPSRQDFQVSL